GEIVAVLKARENGDPHAGAVGPEQRGGVEENVDVAALVAGVAEEGDAGEELGLGDPDAGGGGGEAALGGGDVGTALEEIAGEPGRDLRRGTGVLSAGRQGKGRRAFPEENGEGV